MEMQIQPPKPLPLHVVGWLSLPWRHWGYLCGTLVFGLLFLTFAPFNFLVKLLVLVAPFLSALVLAFPYGGLHMDEWLMLAWKYARKPAVRMRDPQEQEESPGDLLGDSLDDGQQPAAGEPGPQMPFAPPAGHTGPVIPGQPSAWPGQLAPVMGRPESEVWVSSDPATGQMDGIIGQSFLSATSGIFWRGSGTLAGPPLNAALPESPASSETDAWPPGVAGLFWQPPTQQPVEEQPPPSVIPFPSSREPRDHFAADSFLLDQPKRRVRGSPPRKRRQA